MPGWRDEYLASIKDAEKNNPVNGVLVETCSHLQDRVAALEAEKEALAATGGAPPTKAPAEKEAAGAVAAGAPSSDALVARLRLELAEALRSQGQLQSRLRAAEDELETLRAKTKGDARTIRGLTSERNTLATKVRDRDEELKGKSKLVEDVQDELTVLHLQLNVEEQKTSKIRAENKDLVDRWMKRMGQEADAMNLANEPVFAKGT